MEAMLGTFDEKMLDGEWGVLYTVFTGRCRAPVKQILMREFAVSQAKACQSSLPMSVDTGSVW